MASDSFQLRIFHGDEQLFAGASSIDNLREDRIQSVVNGLHHGKWQIVGKPVRKPNSGDFDPPLSGGEVWVPVVPKPSSPAKEK